VSVTLYDRSNLILARAGRYDGMGLSASADRSRATMKMKFDRIISIATLVALIVAIVVMLRRPASVAGDQRPSAGIPVATQSGSAETLTQRDRIEPAAQMQSQPQGFASGGYSATSQPAQNAAAAHPAPKAEPQANSERISAAISSLLGGGDKPLSPDAEIGSGMPNIKDQKVTYDGDTVHGQFLTDIGGKDVWVTISGHMGQKDGYATFDPTEFKVGDVDVPVSLVNPMLQRKLSEERDRLKISSPAQ
jgi:hypothetical protein